MSTRRALARRRRRDRERLVERRADLDVVGFAADAFAVADLDIDRPGLGEQVFRPAERIAGRDGARLASRGSEAGIRKALARLTSHGIIGAQEAGRALLYTLNRDHLAVPALEVLANMRTELERRLSGLVRLLIVSGLGTVRFSVTLTWHRPERPAKLAPQVKRVAGKGLDPGVGDVRRPGRLAGNDAQQWAWRVEVRAFAADGCPQLQPRPLSGIPGAVVASAQDRIEECGGCRERCVEVRLDVDLRCELCE